MMEKDFNKQQMDELLRDWTEERLTPETDGRITESLLDFVENDDSEIDVNDLLDLHIHELAEEELMTRRRKWKTLVASVAAASVVLIMAAIAFLTTREHGHHTDKGTFAVEKSAERTPSAIDRGLPTMIAEAPDGRIDHSSRGQALNREKKRVCSGVSTIAQRGKNGNATIYREERAVKQNEETAAVILTETLAEINAGLLSMADNTKECLSMTNASMLPASLTSDDNETNIIETNLINALYEIRNLNIELNFNTDNKTTEI